MKPQKDQINQKTAYEHDQVPEWWDKGPSHEELLAIEAENAAAENKGKMSATNTWLKNAEKKGPKPF